MSSPSTSEQGYGWTHQQIRRRWAREVELGGVHCARGHDCLERYRPTGTLILPGEPWDLGHDDFDRSRYNGPEHRRCNRAVASRDRRTSREW
jgi:hypothetical protein